ncbi:DNA cytosine methyltransferase [Enterobacter roggenkampii]|nr:DNA cytosine methyltransferase [Enterobacter roggenkampii]
MVIWSLFDGSGIMGQPWAEAGHDVYCFNAGQGNHGEYHIKMQHENLHYVNCWISENFPCKPELTGIPKPKMIFAFPDCTDLAVSGAKHDGHTSLDSVRHAQMVEKMAEEFGAAWMVENPVGKMSTYWRKPDHYFHPFEYGGYTTGKEERFHPRMPPRDAYTKKTCIWSGNGFVMPAPKPVEHIGKFWGWAYLGGKSAKTKQLRSLTPRGFARAVYEANHA